MRVFGLLILLVELGLLFAYGFTGYIITEVGDWGALDGYAAGLIPVDFTLGGEGLFFYISTMIFTVIGFGCLYAAVSRATLSGFFLSFFIVGYTTILSPTLQKFWYNVFIDSFHNNKFNNT